MLANSIAIRTQRSLAAALTLIACASCVSTEHQSRDWSEYDGPGARYFQQEEVTFPYREDPLEPLNRSIAFGNYAVLRWVLAPLSLVYRVIVPESARVAFVKLGENWLFPGRLINNLLQGKFSETGVEISRFAINTTLGVGGLFDPAQDWGLHPYPEDFGQTFACWGWDSSTYLVLPLLGSRTVRDGLGEIPDAFADPASYYFPAAPAREFNSLSNSIEADLRLIHSSYDAYEPARTLFYLQSEVDVEDLQWHEDESGPTQTLRTIFLKPEREDFGEEADTQEVALGDGTKQFPYSLWLQPEPAPLMYVVPGFGGNRFSPSTLALAEIGFAQGHSVVAVSSPTNWEFMRFGASVTRPGYGPVDAHDLHVALTAIDRQLESTYPGRFERRHIAGISIGAYEALLMTTAAARTDDVGDGEDLLQFDLCLALNPPVSIEHALHQLDSFYNAPLEFPSAEREARIEEIFAKVLYMSHGDLQPGTLLPFTELESRFLIGLSFRLDLQYLILQSQDLEDSGVLLTQRTKFHKAPAFREAAEFSYMEYIYACALPYFAEREADIEFSEDGARVMFERSDLRTISAALASHPAIRIFTNKNDFLLRPEDLAWLRSILGTRLTLFEDGGHLGNLYREYIKSEIANALRPVESESKSGEPR